MFIALDYDGTYTKCPQFWDDFIKAAIQNGHKIVCITMRRPIEEERITLPIEVFYTSRTSKKEYALLNGLMIDIWIDDRPEFIIHNSAF